jgi:hypothetical protein
MQKLSDTQLAILSAACQREDRGILPLPANLNGGAAQKVVGSDVGRHESEALPIIALPPHRQAWTG